MSEKEKPKRGTRMGFLRSCLIFSLYPLLILTVIACGIVYWAIGGYVKPSLDPQYIPTAEYLLENTIVYQDIPPEILATEPFLSLRVNLMDSSFSEGQVCFAVYFGFDEDFLNLRWSEIYINEQTVKRFHPNPPEGALDSIPALTYLCVDGHLDSGLHIIEFRAKESIFAAPYYIHRWGIEIP
jgi:hypothetical protein